MDNNPLLKDQSVKSAPNNVKSNYEMQQDGRQKNMYVLSLDGSRIFWILSIILLLMTFVLLLGYWIGSDAAMSTANTHIARAKTPVNTEDTSRNIQTNAPEKAKATITEENMTNAEKAKAETKQVKTENSPKKSNVKFSNGEETVFDPDTGKVRMQKKQDTTRQKISKSIKSLKTKRGVDTYGSDKYMTRSKPYSIQIATHFSLGTAMHVKRKLRKGNHSAYIFMHKSSRGKRFYKIRVGTFTSRSKAKNYLVRLKRTRYGRGAIIVHR